MRGAWCAHGRKLEMDLDSCHMTAVRRMTPWTYLGRHEIDGALICSTDVFCDTHTIIL